MKSNWTIVWGKEDAEQIIAPAFRKFYKDFIYDDNKLDGDEERIYFSDRMGCDSRFENYLAANFWACFVACREEIPFSLKLGRSKDENFKGKEIPPL